MEDLRNQNRGKVYIPDLPFPRFFKRDGKTIVVPFGREDCILRLRTPAVMEFAERDLTTFSALANLLHTGITDPPMVMEWFEYIEGLIRTIDKFVTDDSDEGRFLVYLNCRLYWFYLGVWFVHGRFFQKRINRADYVTKLASDLSSASNDMHVKEMEQIFRVKREALVRAHDSLSRMLGKTRYRPAQFRTMQKKIFENIGGIAAGYSCPPRQIRTFLEDFYDRLPVDSTWHKKNLTPPDLGRATYRRSDYDSALASTLEMARFAISYCQELRFALPRLDSALTKFLPQEPA